MSAALWDEHERMFLMDEQRCQELCQAIEQVGEMIPALQLFSARGPHVVGVVGARRRQHQKEEAV